MDIVIVGSGVAGITAARTIKEIDPTTKVSMYTDETHLYYPRPRLYEILSGEAKPRQVYMFSRQWYERKSIDVHLGKKVGGIETARRALLLKDESTVGYDKLLLANGAYPFIPPIKGVEKTGVFTLRSINDALTIREYAKKTRKATIIGGGLLGLEFAESLRKLGQQVEVVEIFPRLLPRQLDQEGAAILRDQIERRGIILVLGVKTQEITGKKTVSGILLDNGDEHSSNLILLSCGVRSRTELAADAGIKVDKGVVVNQHLQTSVDGVYAAGDVAQYENKVYGIIPAARDQAEIAANNLLHEKKRIYEGTIPSNTLKIVGIDLTSMGLVNPEDPKYEEVRTADRENGIYKKLVLDQGKIVGAIILGAKHGVTSIKRMMDEEIDVTRYRDSILEDDFDLRARANGSSAPQIKSGHARK